MQKKEVRKIQIGKFKISLSDLIALILLAVVILIYLFSPRYYSVTTGLYNQSTEEDQKNVVTALGQDNTEERFNLYFKYYNVIHELGHGLIYYNKGTDIPIAEEEQLVNDFAVAYWKYYGEEEKVKELEDIANYAVENIGDNYKNNIDYMELAKENSSKDNFKSSFFNFNDYGWFQFSCVKQSFKENKDLETVLKEMGFKDFKLPEPEELKYDEISNDVSTEIINDAINNFHSWGLKFPKATHHFDKNPNNNYSRSVVKYLGLFEIADFKFIFS